MLNSSRRSSFCCCCRCLGWFFIWFLCGRLYCRFIWFVCDRLFCRFLCWFLVYWFFTRLIWLLIRRFRHIIGFIRSIVVVIVCWASTLRSTTLRSSTLRSSVILIARTWFPTGSRSCSTIIFTNLIFNIKTPFGCI